MPKGGNWTPLKNDATDFVQGTGSKDITPADLITNFIRVTGGLKGLMRGNGGSAPSIGGGFACEGPEQKEAVVAEPAVAEPAVAVEEPRRQWELHRTWEGSFRELPKSVWKRHFGKGPRKRCRKIGIRCFRYDVG